MNNSRFETLSEVYRRNLIAAVQDNPSNYMLGRLGAPSDPVEYANSTADKMLARVKETGMMTVSKDGEGWKRTCKELGIKHTYKAIEEYLNAE